MIQIGYKWGRKFFVFSEILGMGRKLRKCAFQAMVLNGYGGEMKAEALLMNPS